MKQNANLVLAVLSAEKKLRDQEKEKEELSSQSKQEEIKEETEITDKKATTNAEGQVVAVQISSVSKSASQQKLENGHNSLEVVEDNQEADSCLASKNSIEKAELEVVTSVAVSEETKMQSTKAGTNSGAVLEDSRPQQEYEPPWDLSKTNVILSDCAGSMNTDNSEQQQGQVHKPLRHDYVNAQVEPIADTELSRLTDNLSAACQVVVEDQVERHSPHGGTRPAATCVHTGKQKQPRGLMGDSRLGNYEEPWDLSCTQNILEEAFLANKCQVPDKTSTPKNCDGVQSSSLCSLRNGDVQVPNRSQEPSDSRPQEGYEKPWDWKPHKKVKTITLW